MKFNFPKKFSKDKTKVTRVVIMTETPSESLSTAYPADEMEQNIQPPSPTSVREQAQFSARMHNKEADKTAEWNEIYNRLACGHSLPENCSAVQDVSDDWKDSEAAKRWSELREMMNVKIESMDGNVLGELGGFVEKNRNEIDKMIKNFDVDGPMNWLWNKPDENIAAEESYDNPIMSWTDFKACLEATEDAIRDEQNMVIMVPQPSE